MNTILQRGKIPTPRALVDALDRRLLLDAEIARCTRQIDDPNRALRYKTSEEYDDWRLRAERALANFRQEREQLSVWIEGELARELRGARDLLVELVEDECDFDDYETEQIGRIQKICEVLR